MNIRLKKKQEHAQKIKLEDDMFSVLYIAYSVEPGPHGSPVIIALLPGKV